MSSREPMSPYRKGREAGDAYFAEFAAWRDAAKASRDFTQPRPVRPENPYPTPQGKRLSRRSGRYQWDSGFQWALRQQEERARSIVKATGGAS